MTSNGKSPGNFQEFLGGGRRLRGREEWGEREKGSGRGEKGGGGGC